MLDFNRRATCSDTDRINALIDAALEAERGAVPARP